MPSLRDLSFLSHVTRAHAARAHAARAHAARGCPSFPLLPMTPLTPYTTALAHRHAHTAPQLAGALSQQDHSMRTLVPHLNS